jgi:glycosyltransferase involved in cell wall biosynthesis
MGEKINIIDFTAKNPIVSIAMLAYNHENYIVEAIESALMQKTNFYYQLVISEDFSPDSTRSILLNYQSRFPDKIKLLLQEKNVGLMQNSYNLLSNVDGKYIAVLECDDFWTDPFKLQKQVDFLEKNNDYSMVFHSVNVKNEIPTVNYSYPLPSKTTLTFNDILRKNFVPTCSLMYRKSHAPNPLPLFFSKCMMGDIPLELMLADKGKVFFINEKMATYRKNNTGITLNKNQIKNGRKGYVFVYKNLIKYFFPRHFFSLTLKLFLTKAGVLKTIFK